MKVSDLVKELEDFISQYGDLEVKENVTWLGKNYYRDVRVYLLAEYDEVSRAQINLYCNIGPE